MRRGYEGYCLVEWSGRSLVCTQRGSVGYVRVEW